MTTLKSNNIQNVELNPQDKGLKILFVPRWYPNRIDPMPGLFIQKQAGALAKKHSVQILSVHPDPDCKGTYEIVNSVENAVRACHVYYKADQTRSVFSKLTGIIRYIKAHHIGYHSLMPFAVDIIHGHILTREIFFAWFMARKQGCPYIISEHWSRYYPGNGTYKGLIRKWLTRLLLKNSSGLITVSESLAQAMKSVKLVHPTTRVVPNVVDTGLFVPPSEKPVESKAVILHVSCFEDKSKNISGFLDAITQLYQSRNDFRVLMVGEGPDYQAIRKYSDSLGLSDGQVKFTGLKQNTELVGLYQTASFLVQSSNYETFGTVVIEALACGTPVVSTNTGVASEIISNRNGIIIQQSSVYEMARAIDQMLNFYPTFEWRKFHESVARDFSENQIAEKLTAIYREILSK